MHPLDRPLDELRPVDTTDPVRLRADYARAGAALLRRAVDPALLAPLAEQVAARLIAIGVAEPHPDPAPDPDSDGGEVLWNGRSVEDSYDSDQLPDVPAFHALVEDLERGAEPWQSLGDALLGGRSVAKRSAQLFATFPDDAAYALPPHQDGFPALDHGQEQFRIWMPLFDIAAGDGGLAVCPGTHRRGRFPAVPIDRYRRRARPGRRPPDGPVNGVDLDAIEGVAPATASMTRGDALAFDFKTIHFGLGSRSRRIRTALAIVIVPADAPGPRSFHLVEMAQRRRILIDAAGARGFDEDAAMRALVDLNVAGLEATPEHVRDALDGVHGGWRE